MAGGHYGKNIMQQVIQDIKTWVVNDLSHHSLIFFNLKGQIWSYLSHFYLKSNIHDSFSVWSSCE